MPAKGKQIFEDVVLVGVPIVAPAGLTVHLTLSTMPVVVLVNKMQLSWQDEVAVLVKDATGGGGGAAAVLNETLSIAKEGSVPAPSLSFIHRNPIFTFGLLSALAGSVMFCTAQEPWPPPQVVVFAVLVSRVQVVPS